MKTVTYARIVNLNNDTNVINKPKAAIVTIRSDIAAIFYPFLSIFKPYKRHPTISPAPNPTITNKAY